MRSRPDRGRPAHRRTRRRPAAAHTLGVTRQTLLDLLPPAPPEPDRPRLPPAYQDLLAVLAQHPDGLHAREACLALGLPHTHKNTVEGIRAKLKRLVSRDLATEPKPGLFTIKEDGG
ncbi:hypothetical protein GCM10009550_24620 [Actinocorallia libanotica]|uniref:Uncharacterized protein n=1 Tax=Actinocorallia libanotica TaxID=46162 RepID=A0ABN1QWC9_9ACTN